MAKDYSWLAEPSTKIINGVHFGSRALRLMLNELKPDYVGTVTRNPGIVRMIARTTRTDLNDIYPFCNLIPNTERPSTISPAIIATFAATGGVPLETAPYHFARYPKGGLCGDQTPTHLLGESYDEVFDTLERDLGVLVIAAVNYTTNY